MAKQKEEKYDFPIYWDVRKIPDGIRKEALDWYMKNVSDYIDFNNTSLTSKDVSYNAMVFSIVNAYELSKDDTYKIVSFDDYYTAMFINYLNHKTSRKKVISNSLNELFKNKLAEKQITIEEKVEEDEALKEVWNKLLGEDLEKALDTILPREKEYLKERFGIIDGEEKTATETGKIFNVSSSRALQIEKRALRKLKHPSRSKYYREYYMEPHKYVQYNVNSPSSNTSDTSDSDISHKGFANNDPIGQTIYEFYMAKFSDKNRIDEEMNRIKSKYIETHNDIINRIEEIFKHMHKMIDLFWDDNIKKREISKGTGSKYIYSKKIPLLDMISLDELNSIKENLYPEDWYFAGLDKINEAIEKRKILSKNRYYTVLIYQLSNVIKYFRSEMNEYRSKISDLINEYTINQKNEKSFITNRKELSNYNFMYTYVFDINEYQEIKFIYKQIYGILLSQYNEYLDMFKKVSDNYIYKIEKYDTSDDKLTPAEILYLTNRPDPEFVSETINKIISKYSSAKKYCYDNMDNLPDLSK